MTTSENKIRLYNTMTRKSELFVPLEAGTVKLYVCGPTVYGDPHIGNFRTFTVGDILRRWLDYRGYDVFHVMNITDIDDKTIRDSGKEGVSLDEFTPEIIDKIVADISEEGRFIIAEVTDEEKGEFVEVYIE